MYFYKLLQVLDTVPIHVVTTEAIILAIRKYTTQYLVFRNPYPKHNAIAKYRNLRCPVVIAMVTESLIVKPILN